MTPTDPKKPAAAAPAPAPKVKLVQFKSGPFKNRKYLRGANGQLVRIK